MDTTDKWSYDQTMKRRWQYVLLLYQALLEIMEPELRKITEPEAQEGLRQGIREWIKGNKQQRIKEGRTEERNQEIQNLIVNQQKLNPHTDKLQEILLKHYPLTENEVIQYLQEAFWNI